MVQPDKVLAGLLLRNRGTLAVQELFKRSMFDARASSSVSSAGNIIAGRSLLGFLGSKAQGKHGVGSRGRAGRLTDDESEPTPQQQLQHRKFVMAAAMSTGLYSFASDGHSADASVRLDEGGSVIVRLLDLEFLPCLP